MVGLCIGSVLYLHLPQVQNRLFSKLLQHLSQQTGYHFSHQQFRFTWGHKVVLKNFSISDTDNHPVCTLPYLQLTLNPLALLYKPYVSLHRLQIKRGEIHGVQKQGDEAYNIQQLLTRLTAGDTTSAIFTYKGITIRKALFTDCGLWLDDQTKPPTSAFDPYHIQLESITVALSDLHIVADTWNGAIERFEGYDTVQDINIQHLQGQFSITPKAYLLQHVYITTPYSHLRGDFTVRHQGWEALMVDPYHAHITADIVDLQVDTQELGAACPYLKGQNAIYQFQGKIAGTMYELAVSHCQIAAGNSYVKGTASFQKLSQIDDMHFSVAIDEGCVHAIDILPFVTQQYVPLLQKIAFCNLQTQCTGTLHNMVMEGQFETNMGKVTTNLAIQNALPNAVITYQGEINTIDFNLGALLDAQNLGAVTLQAIIDGQGLDMQAAHAHITTMIPTLTWRSYAYQNIYAAGEVRNMCFAGKVAIDDPHLASHLDLQVNALEAKKAINVQGTLDSLAVDKLGWITQPLQLQSKINIALQGDAWMDLVGKAILEDLHLGFNNQVLTSKEVAITTKKTGNHHTCCLTSDVMDAEIAGTNSYGNWAHDLQTLLEHHKQQTTFGNTLATSQHPYTNTPYTFKYHINCKQTELLLRLLDLDIAITPDTTLHGSFSQSHEEIQWQLETSEIANIHFSQHRFTNSQLKMTASYHKESATLSTNSQLQVQAHQWKDRIATEQLWLAINWMNDTIQLESTLGNANSAVQYNLHATARVAQPTWQLHFQDTSIRLGDERWIVNPKNAIQIHPKVIACQDLTFTCQEQTIALAGQLSHKTAETLDITITNFLLDKLSPLVDTQLAGVIHGTLNIINWPGQPTLQGDLYIQKASVAGLHLGDVAINTSWLDTKQCMQVVGKLTKDEQAIIDLYGFYKPYHTTQQLDLVASFSQTPLVCLEPLITTVVSQLQGSLSGKVSIKGSLAKPIIQGNGNLEDLTLQFTHLKAIYNGHGKVHFLGNTMQVETLHLVDANKGYVDFAGTVAYHTLDNIQLDLQGDMHRVEVLNTTSTDNIHFYGTGVISGDIHLKGPVQQLDIYANSITEEGTRLTIPIAKLNKIAEQEDFIRFVKRQPNQPTHASSTADVSTPSVADLNLYLNLDLTPAAHTKILFSGKNGDTIQAKGKGKLKIEYNINNTFHIAGSCELVEGDYNFTIYEVIRKKFQILPGSTITWVNNIDDGMLQLRATYNQSASLLPLVANRSNINNKETLKTKYPIQVGMSITGILAAPQIMFDIQLLQLPQESILQEAVESLQEKLAADSDYLKTQVFSLIMLKKFAPIGQNLLLEDDNTLLQLGVGELFSQQLNNLTAYISDDLEIETDIDNDKELQVPIKLSYNLWRDRLVIASESKIKLYDKEAMYFRDILDTFSLAYTLTKDKRVQIKLRGYPTGKKLNMNLANPIIGGISVLYLNSSNRLKTLFWKRKYT